MVRQIYIYMSYDLLLLYIFIDTTHIQDAAHSENKTLDNRLFSVCVCVCVFVCDTKISEEVEGGKKKQDEERNI